ncbi:putative zinc metalloprotease [Dendrothele bispora CBS 962.96]|uniref:Peptide hydrolase n=1 Tax=Dendrothele bispora (strain CBS 962.96) TaxID=1314807 RepID=A0A4S8M302_DENBC|nr:putative zinc metalloprotease [Dendrothele bispora CBS 962.96]
MLNQIDPTRIEAIITKLVSFGTRSTLSSQTNATRGIGAARDWIASQMREFAQASNGRMNVTVQSFTQAPTSSVPRSTVISNVFATLRGSQEPNRVYVVSGHYDSRNSDNTDGVGDAPGADDDGSGVAVSMELARIMASHDTQSTIIFAAVAGEEQGLLGSNFMAQQLKSAGVDVQGMLDNDIVGSSTADDGSTDPFNIRMFVQGIPPTVSIDSWDRRFVAEVASNEITNMTVQPVWRPDRFGRGGDHQSFLSAGFPAVRFTEPHENFAHQHQDVRVVNGVQFGDLPEFCDFEFNARVAKVNGVALWSMAQAPGTPKNVVQSTVQSNNATLSWTVDPNAASYEIVWRASEVPQWTNVVPVGKVGTATVQLAHDNAQFAVRAVGANGFKSPAGFPFSG